MNTLKFRVDGRVYTAVFCGEGYDELSGSKKNDAMFIEDDARPGSWAVYFDYKGDTSRYAPYLTDNGSGLVVCIYLDYDQDGNKLGTVSYECAQIWDENVFEEVEMQVL